MSAIRDHNEAAHRNVICCLLSLEIAEYDAKPVFDQIRATQDFRKLLSDATGRVASDDVVSIVREDGALLSFLADPEQCFTTALTIREAALTQGCNRDLPLRIGINLGTVQIAEDEFGHPYVSGEGRRDVDRVMRHGPPRQISVSRPFVELLSRAAPELSGLLEYQGVFSDTVGPPLCLYRLPPPQNDRPQGLSGRPLTTSSVVAEPPVQSMPVPHAVHTQAPVKGRSWLRRSWLRSALLPLLAGTVLLTASNGFRFDIPGLMPAARLTTGTRQEAVPAPAFSSLAPVASVEMTGPAAVPSASIPSASGTPLLVSPMPSEPRTTGLAGRRSEQRPRVTSKHVAVPAKRLTQVAEVAATDVTKPEPAQPPKPAWVVLAVKPWGEVYVDGRKIGITPPLKRFEIPPGQRQITVTNSSLPSYQMQATLGPEEEITVAHDFACVPNREKACREDVGKGLVLNSRFGLEPAQAAR
jgi:PEGA domain